MGESLVGIAPRSAGWPRISPGQFRSAMLGAPYVCGALSPDPKKFKPVLQEIGSPLFLWSPSDFSPHEQSILACYLGDELQHKIVIRQTADGLELTGSRGIGAMHNWLVDHFGTAISATKPDYPAWETLTHAKYGIHHWLGLPFGDPPTTTAAIRTPSATTYFETRNHRAAPALAAQTSSVVPLSSRASRMQTGENVSPQRRVPHVADWEFDVVDTVLTVSTYDQTAGHLIDVIDAIGDQFGEHILDIHEHGIYLDASRVSEADVREVILRASTS